MEWRDVVGYEGIYQVSDTGLVRSIQRDSLGRKSGGYVRHLKERVLTQSISKGGYVRVSINGLPTFVHKLVMQSFIGTRPNGFL